VVVVYTVDVVQPSGSDEVASGALVAVSVASVMGHTVVLMAMVSVVTWPILPGQSVTVVAHEVIV